MESLSVITTVRNEATAIRTLLNALAAQTFAPSEIIVVDANSDDGTGRAVDVFAGSRVGAHATRIRLVTVACNRAAGRNLGVEMSKGELVISIDAGCVPDPDCLRALHDDLVSHPTGTVAVGAVRAAAESLFEEITGMLLPRDPTQDEVAGERWLPTSRLIAFRKDTFQATGGYPDHSSRCGEDIRFARRLRQEGVRVVFVPGATARWRPRPTWSSFFTQYFDYAYGDGTDLLFSSKYVSKLAMHGTAAALLIGGLRSPGLWLLLSALAFVYSALVATRAWRRRPRITTVLLTPPIEVLNDIADVTGFLAGVATSLHAILRTETAIRRPPAADVSGLPDPPVR